MGVHQPGSGGGGGGSQPVLPLDLTGPGALTVEPTDNTIDSLETVIAPAGFADNTSGDGALYKAVDTDSGLTVFEADVYGNITTHSPTTSTQLMQTASGAQFWQGSANADATGVAGTDAAGQPSWKVGSDGFGLFGATPAGQQSKPTTLDDVITILETFGFCASS